MQVTVFDTPEMMAQSAAGTIIEFVKMKPRAVLCLAGGETPRQTYRQLVALAQKNNVDFSAVQFIGLDEWVGIPKTNSGSCYYFLKTTLFGPLSIDIANIHFFDSTSTHLSTECERINLIIQQLQGIDIMLAGIGMNGHIGFNEPGISPELYAHVVVLDSMTLTVGQKYFAEKTLLKKGISLGMAHFMQTRMVLLEAVGQQKAGIIKNALEDKVTVAVPASYIQSHANATVLLDREAASLLRKI